MHEGERDAAVEAFYDAYLCMKQQYGLNMNMRMDASGECELEIYQANGDQKRYISKLGEKEDDGTLMYRKALQDLENFNRKQKQNAITA
jgi:hypothetical protein